MNTTRVFVKDVWVFVQDTQTGKKAEGGGRSITMVGEVTPSGEQHCIVITFSSPLDLEKLRAAIDAA